MTILATPNRPDARTIRAALKAADNTTPVRITSGLHTTYIVLPFDPVSDDYSDKILLDTIVRDIRPLWNDDRVSVDPYRTDAVLVKRAGWHTSAPLESELDVLQQNGVQRVRIDELREDSTRAERVAELDAVIGTPIEIFASSHYYRVVSSVDFALRTRHVCEKHFSNPFQTVTGDPARVVHELLKAVVQRRLHPLRPSNSKFKV